MMFLVLRKLGSICCGHKMFLNKIRNIFCVRNKCCAREQTGKHLCRQQCVGNNVSVTMCPRLPAPLRWWFKWRNLRRWQTRTHCCGNIVAHDVSLRTQTGKHLSRTQNVSEQNQKQLCPGHKICVRNKCCARGQTGKHFCRQQCVRNNVSSFASTFTLTEPVPEVV